MHHAGSVDRLGLLLLNKLNSAPLLLPSIRHTPRPRWRGRGGAARAGSRGAAGVGRGPLGARGKAAEEAEVLRRDHRRGDPRADPPPGPHHAAAPLAVRAQAGDDTGQLRVRPVHLPPPLQRLLPLPPRLRRLVLPRPRPVPARAGDVRAPVHSSSL
eukprot:gene10804-biopygen2127